jgi:cell division protein FtsB
MATEYQVLQAQINTLNSKLDLLTEQIGNLVVKEQYKPTIVYLEQEVNKLKLSVENLETQLVSLQELYDEDA